jgi:membrane-associated phospholipid phosphatase
MGLFDAWDHAVFESARALQVPGLDVLSSVIGLFGRAEVALGIALGLVVARMRARQRDALVPLLLIATFAAEAVLKTLVPQAPPPPDEARTIGLVPLLTSPFAYAFPSGNVARAAFLLSIAHRLPGGVVAAGIIVMAVTRIYLGEHWLSDTIGGAALGLAVGRLGR